MKNFKRSWYLFKCYLDYMHKCHLGFMEMLPNFIKYNGVGLSVDIRNEWKVYLYEEQEVRKLNG